VSNIRKFAEQPMIQTFTRKTLRFGRNHSQQWLRRFGKIRLFFPRRLPIAGTGWRTARHIDSTNLPARTTPPMLLGGAGDVAGRQSADGRTNCDQAGRRNRGK